METKVNHLSERKETQGSRDPKVSVAPVVKMEPPVKVSREIEERKAAKGILSLELTAPKERKVSKVFVDHQVNQDTKVNLEIQERTARREILVKMELRERKDNQENLEKMVNRYFLLTPSVLCFLVCEYVWYSLL